MSTATINGHKWTIFTALIFAVLLQFSLPAIDHWYDKNTPVVAMAGLVVEKTHEHVDVRIKGEKLRQCDYVRMSAMTQNASGLMDADIVRIDNRPNDGATKPPGHYDLGVWRIKPVADGERAMVFVQHRCDGVTVVSKIADVAI